MELRATGTLPSSPEILRSRVASGAPQYVPADSVTLGSLPVALEPRGWRAAAPPLAPAASPTARAVGFDPTNLDPTVRPQDNFYQYAVGGRIARSPIPDDKPSWGVDAELVAQTQEKLRGILEASAGRRNPLVATPEQKIGDFYASGMDVAAIEQAGAAPIRPWLDRIAGIEDARGLQDAVAAMHADGMHALFSFGATPDAKDSRNVIGEAFQGGLTLPERDYYLSQEESQKDVREKYLSHLENMFTLLGRLPDAAREAAETVLRVETKIAEASLSRAEMRDPNALYHPMDRSLLRELTPSFDWQSYFANIGRPDIESINMATPDFFIKMNGLLRDTPLEDLKTYLTWRVATENAEFLSSNFEQEDFNFAGRTLKGVQSQQPRWKRVVKHTDDYLGEALGQKFVEQNFSAEAKARALDMVENIKGALREKIVTGWMSEETKREALAKVDTMVAKIGYPDKWKDYSGLVVDRGLFGENVARARAFHARENLAKIGKPVDPTEWEMTPSTVNAYYHPLKNEIVFPAAILQPPYFDVNADDASNYGSIGATIGHELTHGFDDEGAQFDAQGNLRNWWQPADEAEFKRRADGVERQFNEFVYDGQRTDGKLVKGESIADLGGLELAWTAYKNATEGDPAPRTDDGFTPDQRFFLNYALSWATNLRPEYAHLILSTDPHPLPQFRVLGPLANLPSFHAAFDVKPGDPMARPEEQRNRLWD
ncbi:MAG: M13 family metallopeptidase [Armatimonadetes bacterium]|nr:M13 family metallopeptidase [Armatimonadota bacterium]